MWEFFGGKFKHCNPVKFKSSLPKIKRSEKYLTFVLLCFGTWWVNLTVAFTLLHYENHPNRHTHKSADIWTKREDMMPQFDSKLLLMVFTRLFFINVYRIKLTSQCSKKIKYFSNQNQHYGNISSWYKILLVLLLPFLHVPHHLLSLPDAKSS